MAPPVRIGAVIGLLRELERSARAEHTLTVGGARELAAVLRRELARGAAPGAIREGDSPEGAALLVYVLGRDPDAADEEALRRARRARTPIVAVAAGPVGDGVSIPHVLATDVVRVPAGEGFPLSEIARVIAWRLGEKGALLAARVPLLREAVCASLTSSFARRNGIVAAAGFAPRADLPLLVLNEVRLVLRIAQAHGEEMTQERLPELAGTLGAGFALRALARALREVVSAPAWVLKGAVAYGGTRALGEAAVQRFEAGAAMRRRAGVSRAWRRSRAGAA